MIDSNENMRQNQQAPQQVPSAEQLKKNFLMTYVLNVTNTNTSDILGREVALAAIDAWEVIDKYLNESKK